MSTTGNAGEQYFENLFNPNTGADALQDIEDFTEFMETFDTVTTGQVLLKQSEDPREFGGIAKASASTPSTLVERGSDGSVTADTIVIDDTTYAATIDTASLSAARTLTIPDETGTVVTSVNTDFVANNTQRANLNALTDGEYVQKTGTNTFSSKAATSTYSGTDSNLVERDSGTIKSAQVYAGEGDGNSSELCVRTIDTGASASIIASNQPTINLIRNAGSKNFGGDTASDWRMQNSGGIMYVERGNSFLTGGVHTMMALSPGYTIDINPYRTGYDLHDTVELRMYRQVSGATNSYYVDLKPSSSVLGHVTQQFPGNSGTFILDSTTEYVGLNSLRDNYNARTTGTLIKKDSGDDAVGEEAFAEANTASTIVKRTASNQINATNFVAPTGGNLYINDFRLHQASGQNYVDFNGPVNFRVGGTATNFRLNYNTYAAWMNDGQLRCDSNSGISMAPGANFYADTATVTGGRLMVLSDRVGIGCNFTTAYPQTKLDVNGDNARIRISDYLSTTRTPALEFVRGSTTFGADTYNDWRIINTNGNLEFYTASTDVNSYNNNVLKLGWNGQIYAGLIADTDLTESGDLVVTKNGANGVEIELRTDDTTLSSADYSVGKIVGRFGSQSYADGILEFKTHHTNTTALSSTLAVHGPRVGILDTNPSFSLDVNGTLRATGNVQFDQTLHVYGTFLVESSSTFKNIAVFDQDASVFGDLFTYGQTIHSGNVTVNLGNTLSVYGPANLAGTTTANNLDVTNALRISGGIPHFVTLAPVNLTGSRVLSLPDATGVVALDNNQGIWSSTGSDIYYNTGNVFIGQTSGSEALEVTGNIKSTGNVQCSELQGTLGSSTKIDLTPGGGNIDIVVPNSAGGLNPNVDINFITGSDIRMNLNSIDGLVFHDAFIFRNDVGSTYFPLSFNGAVANQLNIGTDNVNVSTGDLTLGAGDLDVAGTSTFRDNVQIIGDLTINNTGFGSAKITLRDSTDHDDIDLLFQGWNGSTYLNNALISTDNNYLNLQTSNASPMNGIRLSTDSAVAMTVNNSQEVLFESNVGINQTSPSAPLSFAQAVEPKISLYNAGSGNMYGFGVSSSQLNYHVGSSTARHVFYSLGDNGDGDELMRINGAGVSSSIHTVVIQGELKTEGDGYIGDYANYTNHLSSTQLLVARKNESEVALEFASDDSTTNNSTFPTARILCGFTAVQYNSAYMTMQLHDTNSSTYTDTMEITSSNLYYKGSVVAFTAGHNTNIVKETPVEDEELYGLIVCSTGTYLPNTILKPEASKEKVDQVSEPVPAGTITLDNAWASVELSSKPKQKSVIGVYSSGKIGCCYDTINSIGEGGIWITDENGDLENGDYISSSSARGYGMRQESEFLANYTVAKITSDCVFDNSTEMMNMKKYSTYKDEEGQEQCNRDSNGNRILVDMTDASGNVMQYERFKTRWLLPDGTKITQDEYNTKKAAGETVYRAAFVGCTYHCG